jgi:hypothetical protein
MRSFWIFVLLCGCSSTTRNDTFPVGSNYGSNSYGSATPLPHGYEVKESDLQNYQNQYGLSRDQALRKLETAAEFKHQMENLK